MTKFDHEAYAKLPTDEDRASFEVNSPEKFRIVSRIVCHGIYLVKGFKCTQAQERSIHFLIPFCGIVGCDGKVLGFMVACINLDAPRNVTTMSR